MKKIITLCLLAFLGTTQLNAQYVLNEDFSSPTFPPTGWTIGNGTTGGSNGNNNSVWQTVGTYGGNAETGHAFCNFFDWGNVGAIDSLVSPVFTATATGAVISFDETYCPYTGSDDILNVYASTNAGSTWTLVQHILPSDLATMPPSVQPYIIPAVYQWATKQYTVPTGTNRVKFEVISGYGNNLFLDNVTVGAPSCRTKSTTNASFCTGGSYSFNGTNYTVAGTYAKTGLTNAAGCDSIAILNLSSVLGTGYNGKALSFDGNDDYVSLPTGIVSSLNNFTIEAWFFLNNTNTWQRVFDFGSGTGVNMFFTTLSGAGVPRFAITNTGGLNEKQITAYSLSTPLQAGVWHHVAITLNAATTTGTMYIDGVPVGQNTGMTISPSALGATTQNYLGKSQYNDPYFNGSIDEFRIWNTVKTLAQIKDNMGKELTGNEADLVAYYNFNASSGTIFTNNKNNAFNGTLNNFALSGTSSNWTTYNTLNITGLSQVCNGSTITLSNDLGLVGGIWSSLHSSASVNAITGVVLGKGNNLNATIQYKYAQGGCNVNATKVVTSNTKPAIPSIGYAAGTVNPQIGASAGGYCTNRNFIVVGTPTGGVWSRTGVITVNATTGAVATGNTLGAASLTYTTTVNGCSNSRTIAGNVVGCAARGINAADGQKSIVEGITMYPNPAKSFINLNVETLIGAGSIVVTDLYGKTVKTQTLSMGTNTVDIANLSKGFYLVSIITAEGKATKKLVVE